MDEKSFLSFCDYIMANVNDDVNSYAIGEVYLNFIEPFAEEHAIKLSDEFIKFMEDIIELMEEELNEENDDDCSDVQSDDESQIDSDTISDTE